MLSRILAGTGVVVAAVACVWGLTHLNPVVVEYDLPALAGSDTPAVAETQREGMEVPHSQAQEPTETEDATATTWDTTGELSTTAGAAEGPGAGDRTEHPNSSPATFSEAPTTTLAPWDPRNFPQAEMASEAEVAALLADASESEPEYAGEPVPPEVVLTGSGWDTSELPTPGAGGRGGLVCPVAGHVSFIDSWGYPRSGGRRHAGQDMFADSGTPLVAIQDGVISRVDPVNNYKVGSNRGDLGGITIWLTADDGTAWYYAHMLYIEAGITVGKRVKAGEKVGAVGNTGNAATTPPHLHIQMHPGGGEAANPYPVLKAACG